MVPPPPSPSAGKEQRSPEGRRKFPPALSIRTRILLHALGWTVVVIGVAGLALPGIQGLLTIAAGTAILSLASDKIHRWLRGLLRRWPKASRRLERTRRRLLRKLSRRS